MDTKFTGTFENMIIYDYAVIPGRIRCHKKGTIAITSLRPGCWLENLEGYPLVVTINSSKLKRICVYWPQERHHDSWNHEVLWVGGYRYIGLGKRRWWYRLLPSFLRDHVCEFTRPHATP